ncbi:5961_t:CDS:2 [Racocetra fulgida]|uniref:5961_t:CDS:1 n=1 Tax=Racocetra fulgida TaxID=60492 RepID=A0A9N9EBP3_9GLOM|nr:5961_t:CDS:2 [Racocetra fulgida]
MYDEESTSNINNNLSTECPMDLTQDQTNISLPNVYNNPSIEWFADFIQGDEDQTNNSLSTEWPMDMTQDQTNINLPNVYNNPFIEWASCFSQDQTNNNLPIEWSTDFTNNNSFIEWNTGFTQYQINTSLLNIHNNSIIELSAGITRNYEDQTNHNQSMNLTTRFTQDQTNTRLLNVYNTEIIQHREGQINNLQQHDTKSVKKNEHPVSLISRHKKRKICKKYNNIKVLYDENSNQCRDCYGASLCVLSGNKLIDDFIESSQTSYGSCKSKSKLEFIPYEQFTNIEYLAKGGFSVIYKATWVDGPITLWKKLRLLHRISEGLDLMDLREMIHHDLHSGNILIKQDGFPTIADLGISKPIDDSSDNNAVYGVIPYVAPEVLKGEKFTHASDIYSFAMIIWEVISGCRPFSDRKHDEFLILDIINGLRPKIPINIPQELVDLMEICWHQDPEKRKLHKRYNYTLKKYVDWLKDLIMKVEKGEIKFPENESTNILQTKINEQAIYSSRSLTPLISKALNLQTDDDSKAIEFDINKL